VLEPWQRQIVEDIYGWKRDDGSLRYRWVYVEVPKGNGKTAFAATLVLVALHWFGDVGAEVYSAAGDRAQARLIYADVRGMTLESPELASKSMLYTNSIVVPATQCAYKVLSADASSKHGFRPNLVAFDELHVQPNRKLFDALKSGIIKRPDGMLVMLTTAGEYDEESLCWTEHEYALAAIADPTFDPSYYAVVYAADAKDDPGDERTWAKANPNLGVTVSVEGLRDEYRRARRNPGELASFRQLHLNVWAQSAEGVVDMACWVKCAGEPVCQGPAYGGMDLSLRLDLTAAALYFPETRSVIVKCWLPEGDPGDLDERKRRDAFDYARAVLRGELVLTPGQVVDLQFVRRQWQEWAGLYDLVEIGFDPYNAGQLANQLQHEDGFVLTQVRQGAQTLSEPFKDLVGEVKNLELRHGGNGLLTYAAGNVKAHSDANENWRPVKHKGGRKRIDPWTALLNAKARANAATGDGSDQSWVMGGIEAAS